jgi:hypothetical protein
MMATRVHDGGNLATRRTIALSPCVAPLEESHSGAPLPEKGDGARGLRKTYLCVVLAKNLPDTGFIVQMECKGHALMFFLAAAREQ